MKTRKRRAETRTSPCHTVQSDQSEIRMINNSFPKKRVGDTFHTGRIDVNTLYQVTGQRVEEITGNDEKHQMKASQNRSSFSPNTGLRAAKGTDLAQPFGKKKKKKSVKKMDY